MGNKAEIQRQTRTDNFGEVQMECFISTGGLHSEVEVHKLTILAFQFPTTAEAEAEFPRSIAVADIDTEPIHVDGLGDQAVKVVSTTEFDDRWYCLWTQDDNLIVRAQQDITPANAIPEADVEQLSTDYINQVLAALKST